MTKPTKLTRKAVIEIAAKTGSDPRTVQRVAEGKPVKAPSLKRILPALQAAGLMLSVLVCGCSKEWNPAILAMQDADIGAGRGGGELRIDATDAKAAIQPAPDAGIPAQDTRPVSPPDVSPVFSPDVSPVSPPDTTLATQQDAKPDTRPATVTIRQDAHAYPDVVSLPDGKLPGYCAGDGFIGTGEDNIYGGIECSGKYAGTSPCATDCFRASSWYSPPSKTDPDQTTQVITMAKSIDNPMVCKFIHAEMTGTGLVDAFGAFAGTVYCVPHGQCDVYCPANK